MACIFGDQPERVRISAKGAVHAAAYVKTGGYKSYASGNWIPIVEKLRIACKRTLNDIPERWIISRNTSITCKHCLKAMGLLTGPEIKRYIVYNTKTEEFFRNTNTRFTQWTEDINDSYLFKNKHAAEDRCLVIRYRVKDVLISYKEWEAAGSPMCKREEVKDENLEVKQVTITIDK